MAACALAASRMIGISAQHEGVAAAIPSTAAAVSHWQEQRFGHPSSFQNQPPDKRVIVCFIDGAFTRLVDGKVFGRVIIEVADDGSVSLDTMGYPSSLPLSDHP